MSINGTLGFQLLVFMLALFVLARVLQRLLGAGALAPRAPRRRGRALLVLVIVAILIGVSRLVPLG